MPRYFTRYRKNSIWKKYNLKHVTGKCFENSDVSVGDSIYLVTVKEGNLYLCGKLVVGKLCNVDEAAAIFSCKPQDLWKAKVHIVASATTDPMRFDLIVPLELTRQLLFKRADGTKPLVFKSPDCLEPQTLRNLAELEPVWAAKLDELLPPIKKVLLLDKEMFPEEIADTQTYYGSSGLAMPNSYQNSRNQYSASF